MAYENTELVIAGMSREIYMAEVKGSIMSDKRKIVTEDCLRATTEWFIGNKKKCVKYEIDDDGYQPTLFFTQDPEKAKKILKILKNK